MIAWLTVGEKPAETQTRPADLHAPVLRPLHRRRSERGLIGAKLPGMETRSIGKLDASVVGLGCNNFGGRIDEAAIERVVHAALDAGITLFDTADIYGGTLSEEYLGRALGARRDEAIVATKFGGPIDEERKGGASAAYIARAVEDSLRRLGTDRIDLYQLHFPDAATPFEETLGALDKLVRAGKVLEIGGSNFSAEQIDETAQLSADRGLARFVSVQNEYSLLRRGPERFGVLDACARERSRVHPVLPARERRAHGQVPPQRGAAGGNTPRGHARRARRRRALRQGVRPGRGARRVTRAITATRCSSSRSPGCSRARPSRA